jgi:hypothetical protein
VDPVNDFYSGLFGVSMIASKGALQENGLVRRTHVKMLTDMLCCSLAQI